MKWNRLCIVVALVAAGTVVVGCESFDVFKSQGAKDAAISMLEGQVEEQDSALQGLVGQLKTLADQTADAQGMSDEDRAKFLADFEKIQSAIADREEKYGPLLNALLTAKDKPTAGEAFGSIGTAASSLLPYPFNLIVGMAATGLAGAGATKRRKDGQMAVVVESISKAHTGGGHFNMDVAAAHQKKHNVQGLVDRVLRNLKIEEIDAVPAADAT